MPSVKQKFSAVYQNRIIPSNTRRKPSNCFSALWSARDTEPAAAGLRGRTKAEPRLPPAGGKALCCRGRRPCCQGWQRLILFKGFERPTQRSTEWRESGLLSGNLLNGLRPVPGFLSPGSARFACPEFSGSQSGIRRTPRFEDRFPQEYSRSHRIERRQKCRQ